MNNISSDIVDKMLAVSSQFKRLSMMHNRNSDRLKAGERAVLLCIAESPEQELKGSEIAGALGVAAPGVTFVLNRMEEKGFIKRTMDKKDRRAVIVTITEQGRLALEETIAELKMKIKKLAEYLGEDDSRTLIRIANKLVEFHANKKDFEHE